MSDPRKNLPSASSLERLVLCPGSWNLERNLPAEESEYAASGTAIHAALEQPESKVLRDALDKSQRVIYELCLGQEQTILRDIPGFQHIPAQTEQRLWLCGEEFEPIFSGQFDRLYYDKENRRALIIDFKTGFKLVEPAEANWQMLAYAALIAENYAVDEVVCAIVQPRSKNPISTVRYSGNDLIEANHRVIQIVLAASKEDAPRVPGEKQCNFCRAKTKCPEALATVDALAKEEGRLTPAEFGRWLTISRVAKKVIEKLEDDAKALLKSDPAGVDGWKLGKGRSITTITASPQVVMHALTANGFSDEEAIACFKASLPSIITRYGALHGCSDEEAKDQVEKVLSPFLSVLSAEPSLRAIAGEKKVKKQ
jgi:CRISPR/Cas system-associated exonuclease Cas4 (RecB family)